MGQQFLIDTNILVYSFRNEIPEISANWLASILMIECNISVMSKIEILGYKTTSSQEQDMATTFVKNCTLYPLTDEIIDKTIEIRRQYKLKTPDAIIAATALVHRLTLVSRNDADFQRIKHLKYVNPFRF